MATKTRGNVIVEDIKVGDIHYEFENKSCIKCEVVTLPVRDDYGCWTWKSKHLTTGEEIDYIVREGMAHYASNLYDYGKYKAPKESWGKNE